jgi:biotin operon repressor
VDHVNINEGFLEYLKQNHTGAGRAIQSKGLERRLQMSGRKIRDIVNTLRCEGYPICSDDGGYYYAANRYEVYGSIKQLNSRIENIAKAKNGLVESLSLFQNSCNSAKIKIWMVSVKEG